ncbi:GntR family transcriptional regulator [Proteiniborus sp. MB09-C3]|uniref:GntR family transcriptional regulator n=1 Tax=Proteiniborus sp. MB09-C3 TaxID=3050072 RepID=UPI002553E1A3|nr:GntR family transcriptional regulator [Proteiniborus sp. MB09-C3]WIV11628.1 GntR family transcriptional regulator [Proteiniborus sp. MB09-C3]
MEIFNSMVPKYYIIKNRIIEMINSEEITEAGMIPSERELVSMFNVSRITVKRAIDELVNEGYLYRIQGKGTFIKSDEGNHDLVSLMSCTQDIIRMGMTPSKKLIFHSVQEADAVRVKRLQLAKGDKVLMLKRVYYADNEPLNYTTTYLPCKVFLGIEDYDFSKESIYDVVENKYGVKITKTQRTLEAVLAIDEAADHLELVQKEPVILFRAVTMGIVNGKEIPIETFKSFYRTDRFKFYIDQVK